MLLDGNYRVSRPCGPPRRDPTDAKSDFPPTILPNGALSGKAGSDPARTLGNGIESLPAVAGEQCAQDDRSRLRERASCVKRSNTTTPLNGRPHHLLPTTTPSRSKAVQ